MLVLVFVAMSQIPTKSYFVIDLLYNIK